MSGVLDQSKCLVAIIAIAFIAFIAMNKSIDGQLILACIIAIAGLGGYDVYTTLKKMQSAEGSSKT